MEKTLVIIKPDAVQRALSGEIIARLERKGLKIVALKMLSMSLEQAQKMYSVHKGKHFCEPLIEFVTSSPCIVMALEGKDAVSVTRTIMGKTNCAEAAPGSIRGDFGVSNRFNLVHGSDSVETAERELAIFFADNDYIEYELDNIKWYYDFYKGEVV